MTIDLELPVSIIPRVRTRRLLAITGAVALAGSLLPGAALAAGHESPEAPGSRGIDRVCPAGEPVENVPVLADVDDTTHEAAITCAVDYGFAGGFTDGTYRPSQAITRGQAASIATQLIEVATGETLPAPAESVFSDVADTTHEVAIDKLEAVGVVQGRADGTFAPNESVTRGQMTRIIANAIDVADTGAVDGSRPEADANEYFADAVGSTFQADIQALAGIGVVQGRTATAFEPNASVTRGQMAAFVMRGADFLDREQRFLPTAVIEEFDVTLAGENEVSTDDGTLGAGELNTTATATITVDAFNGELGYVLNFADVTGPFDGAAGFHIHEGGLAENGDIVAFLADGAAVQAAADDDLSVLSGTFLEEDAADGFRFADLIEYPDSYYLNLHSNDFPVGAVRGQLPEGGLDLLTAETFELTLTGAAEVDAEGNTDLGEIGASATASLTVDPVEGTVSHTVTFAGVTGPFTAAPGYHIHVGAADENGPVVLFLATATQLQAAADDAGSVYSSTISDVDPALLRAIITQPANYYVNLHSDDFPAGAVRAQLG